MEKDTDSNVTTEQVSNQDVAPADDIADQIDAGDWLVEDEMNDGSTDVNGADEVTEGAKTDDNTENENAESKNAESESNAPEDSTVDEALTSHSAVELEILQSDEMLADDTKPKDDVEASSPPKEEASTAELPAETSPTTEQSETAEGVSTDGLGMKPSDDNSLVVLVDDKEDDLDKDLDGKGDDGSDQAATDDQATVAATDVEKDGSGDATSKAVDDKDVKTSPIKSDATVKDAAKSKAPGSLNAWVSGLGSSTRATDLKTLFSKHGKVLGAKVVTSARNPGSRCYGIVTMSHEEEILKCIEHLNKTKLDGQTIAVSKAKSDITSVGGKAQIKPSGHRQTESKGKFGDYGTRRHYRGYDRPRDYHGHGSGRSPYKPHGSRPSTSSSYHTSPKDKTGAIKSSGEGTEQKPEDKEKIDIETKEGEEKNIEKDGDGKNDKSASGSHSHEKSGPRKVVPFDIIKAEKEREWRRRREVQQRAREWQAARDVQRERIRQNQVQMKLREEQAKLSLERDKIWLERERLNNERMQFEREERHRREKEKKERERMERDRLEQEKRIAQLRLEEERQLLKRSFMAREESFNEQRSSHYQSDRNGVPGRFRNQSNQSSRTQHSGRREAKKMDDSMMGKSSRASGSRRDGPPAKMSRNDRYDSYDNTSSHRGHQTDISRTHSGRGGTTQDSRQTWGSASSQGGRPSLMGTSGSSSQNRGGSGGMMSYASSMFSNQQSNSDLLSGNVGNGGRQSEARFDAYKVLSSNRRF